MAKFKAYITKYALTRGIFELEVEENFDVSPTMVIAAGGHNYFDNEWHRTRAEAVARVRDIIATTRNTTKKNLAKLEELERSLEDDNGTL